MYKFFYTNNKDSASYSSSINSSSSNILPFLYPKVDILFLALAYAIKSVASSVYK